MDGANQVEAAANEDDGRADEAGDRAGSRAGAQNTHGDGVGNQRCAGGAGRTGHAAADHADHVLTGNVGLAAHGQDDGEQSEQGAEGVDAAKAHGPADCDGDDNTHSLAALCVRILGKDVHQGAGDVGGRTGGDVHPSDQDGHQEHGQQSNDEAARAAGEDVHHCVDQRHPAGYSHDQCAQRRNIHGRHAAETEYDQQSKGHNNGNDADHDRSCHAFSSFFFLSGIS